MSTATATPVPCAAQASVFQHPLLEEPLPANAAAAVRRRRDALAREAAAACRACPVLAACLYRAVIEHDVAGYVAGTTARQRTEIRRVLKVTVAPEDLDTIAGVLGGHRQVDHAEVIRLRHANPDESLETLARRLGCSLSTVKRHLRRERSAPSAPARTTARPTLEQVLAASAQLTHPSEPRRTAA